MTEHRDASARQTVPGRSRFILFSMAGRSRALVLLVALVGQILMTSLDLHDYLLPGLIQAVVVLAAMVVATDSTHHLRTGLFLGIPALTLSVLNDFTDLGVLDWIGYGFTVALFIYIIRLMLGKIFRATVVTLDTIGYALCTYILLGTLWTLLYAPVAILDPDAFTQPIMTESGGSPGATMIYYSFVTLTTLGYGDISPVSPLARSLAILEALTGTLFLAVLISRLVGAYGAQRR